jgi:cellulose synthase/poly-beta-1,6-N-acetylglucosamine synthase-like glycosyltransferase
MNKLISISIGVPAHNEERTLPRLLDSILNQRTKSAMIREIIICCDWCTDDTSAVVKKYQRKYPLIKLIDDGKKLGQAKRLEQMYKLAKSEIFMTFDADTKLGSSDVVENMAKPFADSSIGLVGGTDLPFPSEKFFEKVAAKAVEIWQSVRVQYRNGKNVHNHHGCASAIRTSCAKKITYPKNPIGNDEYLYFAVKKMGLDFEYVKNAPVLYRLPINVSDYIKQNTRFLNTHEVMESIFGKNIYDKETVPNSIKNSEMLRHIFKSPALTFLAICLQFLIRLIYFVNHNKITKQTGWLPVASTKN